MKKQQGSTDIDGLFSGLIILGVILLIIAASVLVLFTKIEFSNQNVSGVAYNVKNDEFPIGNTSFSIRASENTYITEENKSSYCLPKGSEYIELVNKAAENKDIKLIVKTERGFWWKAPFTCIDNVTVEERK